MRRLFPGKTEREEREQLRSELISGMQALEHSLVEERAQFHTELTNGMQVLEQTLTEEIRRLATPPDFSPLRTDFINRVKAVEQVLLREIQQGRVSSGLAQVPEKLDHVQGQVETLFSLVTQLSPVLASGESKPIREEIKVHIDAAHDMRNEISASEQ